MTVIANSLNPARIVGQAVFVFALISCAIAWIRGCAGAPHSRRLAGVLTLLEAALLLDMVFNARWLLHDLLANVAKAHGLYGERSGPQRIALDLLGIAVATGFAWTCWIFRGRPGAALAACGGMLSLSCRCIEVVSLHGVDAFLYHSVHGVMPIKIAWALCSLMTGAGILWDTFAKPASACSGQCLADAPTASVTRH